MVTVDWLVLAPALVPALGAVVVLVLDAVWPGAARWMPALGAVLCAAGSVFAVRGALADDDPLTTLCTSSSAGACLWSASASASTLQAGVLLASAAALALLADDAAPPARDAAPPARDAAPPARDAAPPARDAAPPADGSVGTALTADGSAIRRDASVATALVLAACAGGVAVGAARDVGSWLVTLELATVPVVALVALRGDRRAGHSALTLLVTSLTSFALVVLGVALWVTATGDAVFGADAASAAWADGDRRAVLAVAVVALVAGLGFKVSLVPFHAWTPQVYSSADLGTALLLAGASKVAATAALLVVASALVDVGGGGPVAAVLVVAAVASLVLGSVVALRQDDPTRLLAWSAVAQAGWVVAPVAALSVDGVRAAQAYVLVYAGATVVAFAAVALVGARTLDGFRGLLRRDPLVGGALGLALLVLAGLPPGVVGLVAKVRALRPVVAEGAWVLAAAAVLAVVVGLAVYLRWFALLFAEPAPGLPARAGGARGGPMHGESVAGDAAPGEPGGEVLPHVIRARWAIRSVLCIGTAVLAVLSIWPQGLLGLLT
ncbi:MAG: proton-conducting transporter membrane subunit [Dermatophilaceae bacterium]